MNDMIQSVPKRRRSRSLSSRALFSVTFGLTQK